MFAHANILHATTSVKKEGLLVYLKSTMSNCCLLTKKKYRIHVDKSLLLTSIKAPSVD